MKSGGTGFSQEDNSDDRTVSVIPMPSRPKPVPLPLTIYLQLGLEHFPPRPRRTVIDLPAQHHQPP
jgi:hypothetical protein